MIDPVDLARALIRIDTADANEDEAIHTVASPLRSAGFNLHTLPWMPGRSNLLARWRGGGGLVLAAHLDTVPYDRAAWSTDPLGADLIDGRIYGRGASDMKGGAAAMVAAAIDAAGADAAPFSLLFTSAEETGCHGARTVIEAGAVDRSSIFLIGEATENTLRLGHKGATWFDVAVRGRAAHGARPDLGINAIDRLADAIVGLRRLEPGASHAQLGSRTINVGTVAGGLAPNLVPALARMTVDVRTVPDADATPVGALLASMPDSEVRDLLALPALWTSEDDRAVEVLRALAEPTDTPSVGYFTDGAVLADPERPRAFILGPGELDQPHTADESCRVDRIAAAHRIYSGALQAWTDGLLR